MGDNGGGRGQKSHKMGDIIYGQLLEESLFVVRGYNLSIFIPRDF